MIGYRTYPNEERLGFADENRLRYRRLLFDLKAKNDFAVQLLASLLCLVYDDLLGGPDAIACVPTSSKSKATRDDAIALLAQTAVSLGLGALDGSSWLRRTKDVPKAHEDPAMRKFAKQHETIKCVPGKSLPALKHILLIDDICTTGQTMEACVERLRETFPKAEITAFAFGYTGWVDESPCVPDFPKRNQPVTAVPGIVDAWRDEAWPLATDAGRSPFFSANGIVHKAGGRCVRDEAESNPVWSKAGAEQQELTPCRKCRPFAEKPRFVLNSYSSKIHHIDCDTGPTGNGCRTLWSLRHGIRLNGEPCRNCMGTWPVAKVLYEERRKRMAAEQPRVEYEIDLDELLLEGAAPDLPPLESDS